jgi:hypothetical protein
MSLLKNQNNDFEKRLNKHLSDTEYKPSESLWERIDNEVNKPEFEQKVEGKVGRYEFKPRPETWEYIEAHLPPEPGSNRKFRAFWYSISLLVIVSGIAIGYQISGFQTEKDQAMLVANQPAENNTTAYQPDYNTPVDEQTGVVASNQTSEKTQTKSNISTPIIEEQTKQVAQVENKSAVLSTTKSAVKHRNTILSAAPKSDVASQINRSNPIQTAEQTVDLTSNNNPPTQKPNNIIDIDLANNSSKNNATNVGDEPNNLETNVTGEHKNIAVNDSNTRPDNQQPLYSNTSPNQEGVKLISQANDSLVMSLPVTDSSATSTPSRVSISVLVGTHQSNMRLVAPSSLMANKNMRDKVESPKWDISAGILLDYKLNDNWFMSTGLMLTGFKMNMTYGTAPSNNSAQIEKGVSYQHERDSIIPGNALNMHVKYSWNEIPLLLTYAPVSKKPLGLEMKGGLSYAIINVVDVSMVTPNNIGVMMIKNKEGFPTFQNTLFAHLYVGINYAINPTVKLTAMPYARYSVNSMVKRNDYIQQHPWMIGMSVGLRKSF